MKRRQKITEFFFNEQDGIAEVYTHNTDLKKRLTQYAKTYPQLCQLTEADEDGGMRFEIDKRNQYSFDGTLFRGTQECC